MKILFIINIFLIIYHYLLYPVTLYFISLFKKNKYSIFDKLSDKKVSILMSVYNEEMVIEEKIRSIFNSAFPSINIELLIISDASVDKTNEIIQKLSKEFPQIQFLNNKIRKGKPENINFLVKKAIHPYLIITDANVLFTPTTINGLICFFKDSRVGLVDSSISHKGLNKKGISLQENFYIRSETKIKKLESQTFGYMMGPFGGCYAIRKELYRPVPKNFLVDDFYINTKVLERGFLSINSTNSIVVEDVSSNFNEEFRRKKRIATGNYQNLFHNTKLLFSSHFFLSFYYLSHKVLRWFGWLFLLNLLLLSPFLYSEPNFKIFIIIYLLSIFAAISDRIFRVFNKQILFLRFITHFYGMNLALFYGFINYLKGVKTNVWQPTKRNQSK